MQAVTFVSVSIQDMNIQPISGPGIEDRARYAPVPGRLVGVGQHELGGIGDLICRVAVLTIDQTIECRGKDFLTGYPPRLVAGVEHAVSPVVPGASLGRERAVIQERLNLEEDISASAGHWRLLYG
jgi:hypothetical protein